MKFFSHREDFHCLYLALCFCEESSLRPLPFLCDLRGTDFDGWFSPCLRASVVRFRFGCGSAALVTASPGPATSPDAPAASMTLISAGHLPAWMPPGPARGFQDAQNFRSRHDL